MTAAPENRLPEPAEAPEPTLPAPPSASASSVVAGVKRPAPSLLPPFEPLSSSPGYPRPLKRQTLGASDYLKYPTPVPTSSTGILSSSPPHVHGPRPGLARSQSGLTERAPLSAVRSVELYENGEPLLMGRSSNSSHYQLSANRLISRVHVKARYIAATDPVEPNKIEIVCTGWNGLKLHSQGRTWELAKNDTFTSETEHAEIMVDAHDARVMIEWPRRERHESVANLSDSSWDDSPRIGPVRKSSMADLLQSSPLRRQTRIKSPESPTPAHKSSSSLDAVLMGDKEAAGEPVHIYEDPVPELPALPKAVFDDIDASFAQTEVTNSFSSDLSDPEENDPDEENDPIVHSFGPFGANLSGRLAAAFTAGSPPHRASRLASADRAALSSVEPEEPLNSNIDVDAVRNHVVNQLAYSRLQSTPLSTIMSNLPSEEKSDLGKRDLRRIIEETTCIGTIARHGKDAAGKALESEYYYVPEADTDESRRLAVTDGLRKPSLRACRKQHKVT